jgi:uncharacterized protein YkwD
LIQEIRQHVHHYKIKEVCPTCFSSFKKILKEFAPQSTLNLNLQLMKTYALRAIVPMVFLFTLISCSSNETEEIIAPKAELIQNYDYNSSELQLADLINEHRVSVGLNPLQLINHVSYKSEEHNAYMIARQVVNHDLFYQRSENIIEVLGAVKVNENVAYNFISPNSALNAWLNSPGHKLNIEGSFTHFGISIREDATTGKKYYTNIFVKK